MSGGKPIVRKILVVGLSVWGLLACSLICAGIVFWNAETDELEKRRAFIGSTGRPNLTTAS